MAKSASAKPKAFRRAHLWVASLIALSLGGLAAAFVGLTSPGLSLELAVSDTLRAACPLPDASSTAPVTTIEIDDGAIAHPQGGRWAWPRPKQAMLVDALASLGPRLIVLDIEYSEPEEACVGEQEAADGSRDFVLVRDPDPQLREAVARAGNVLIPFSVYIAGRPESGRSAKHQTRAVPASLVRHAVDLPPEAADRLLVAEAFSPMIADLAEAAAGSGYTSILKDPDNAVRRIPLLVRGGGRVFPHLGLEMAGQWRFGPDYRVTLVGNRLTLTSADGKTSVGVPVEANAQLSPRWPKSLSAMDRMSAGPLLDLVDRRRRLDELRSRWRLIMAEVDGLFPKVAWAEARRALDEALAKAADRPAGAAVQADVGTRREALDRAEEQLAMGLAEFGEGPPRPATDETAAPLARAAQRYWPFIKTFHETQETLEADLEKAAARLRPRVEGHLCIVGLNATAITDQHKTPISDKQPGVTVYPAVMQTILSGMAFRHVPTKLEYVIAVLAAWLVGVLAARLPTGWGIAATVWLSAGMLVIARLTAGSVALLLPVAGPVLAVVVAFAGVSGYRQLTEASSRRFIAHVFEQYTSPELLGEILRNPESLRLGGARRDITVIFSDIAGFTPLSEKLDAEKLVTLLNHYLGTMTDILKAESATLDKYEGDGILAFIGAPVRIPDHPLRAVRAALRMQDALPRVCRELAEMGLLPEGAVLRIRVGCSSGPASVGNFGSEKRVDYTAMGDTVNLGGRLEEANRWLNTKILVPEATRQACDDTVLFRRLGPARIRGKAEPVTLYEPLALAPAPQKLQAVAEAFNRAIEALERSDVSAAEAALAELLTADPDDGPAQALKTRIEAIRAEQVSADEPWNLARPK